MSTIERGALTAVNAEVSAAVCQKVISLICKRVGFDAVKRSALETLSDLFGTYIVQLFRLTNAYAQHSNRSRPNIHDLEHVLTETGLKKMNIEEFFRAAAIEISNDDLAKIFPITESEENTIEQTLPLKLLEGDMTEDQPEYVPDFLPKFPSQYTYKRTPVYVHRIDNPQHLREINQAQTRLAADSLKHFLVAENRNTHTQDATSDNALSTYFPLVNYEFAIQLRKPLPIQGQTKSVGWSDLSGVEKEKEHNDIEMGD
ncbi:uncharacterized protein VTP21DRAFT_5895 [Calcarisporiella thermophila]|uniref:uncharacterized protein n=1 Tax=Calcarisporiella thermophila TaxID=911321 RepID=UPI00374385EC